MRTRTRSRGVPMMRLCIALLVATAAPHLAAQTNLAFSSLPGSLSVTNGVFQESVVSLPVTVSHSGDAADWFITVSRGNASSFDPRLLSRRFLFFFTLTVDYNIFTPGDGIARDLSVPLSASQVISGSFPASAATQTRSAQFEVRLPAEQFARPGTYRDEVDVSLYHGTIGDPNNAVRMDRRTVLIESVTASVAELGLVPPGGPPAAGVSDYQFDFGPLVPGAVRSADVIFRSNGAYVVEAASANGGRLLNVNRPGTYTIPYEFRYDGSVYNLSSPRTVDVSFFSGTGASFQRRPVRVTIGSFSSVPSGLYEDVITFTISGF